jgi:hypothetical protein
MEKENRETMMNEQPDKLFRKKLSSFEKPAPPAAWDRIEAGLAGSKKSSVPYWRVAAAVLVVATFSFLIINNKKEATPPQIAHDAGEQQPDASKSPAQQSPTRTDSGNITVPLDDAETSEHQGVERGETKPPIAEPLDSHRSNERPKSPAPDHTQVKERQTSPSPVPPTRPEGINETLAENASQFPSDTMNDPIPVGTPSSPARESITLVMTVDDTNAYLKKNAEGGATSGSRKTSTLKRVLQKASELKNNDQDPFGDLRQMKNEILALNFKSEKQREQKQVN